MDDQYSVQGAAALSICESLLLCLGDMGLMTDKDVIGILEDAASAHVTGEPGGGSEQSIRYGIPLSRA